MSSSAVVSIGIHDLAVATASHVLDLDLLAERAGVDPAKFHIGLGQDQMSVPGPDEDVVTMGATAAARILERHGAEGIRTLFFATESGVDQSKSAGVFVHSLLGLPTSCRVVEFKQACYSATAALQAAAALVARNPHERVLVIASDIARYDLDSAAEATQGAGAVAMLVASNPALMTLEPITGIYTADVDDFWRPNDSVTAVVDGKLSISAYLDGIAAAWDDYRAQGGISIDQIDQFCHHQPFTKMAAKAHRHLGEHTGLALTAESYEASTGYNRRIGNTYTASLYMALAALLDSSDDLAGTRVGLFSYGSGSVSEFFTGVVSSTYLEARRRDETESLLAQRTPINIDHYRELHASAHLTSQHDTAIAPESAGPYHFVGVSGRARQYTSD